MLKRVLPIYFCLMVQSLLGYSQDTLNASHLFQEGDVLYKARNYPEAIPFFEQAAEEFEREETIQRAGHSLLRLGNCYYRQTKLDTAIDVYHRCIDVLLKEFDENEKELTTPLMNIGAAYGRFGDNEKAIIYIQKAYNNNVKNHGPYSVHTAHTLYNLGYYSISNGDYNNAKAYFLQSLPIYIDSLGDKHRKISDIYVNLGILHDKMGDVDHAIEYYFKANEIDISNHGEDYWLLAYNYNNLGLSYNNLYEDSTARFYLKKSLIISEKNDLFEVTASSYKELSKVYFREKNYEEAERLLQKSVEVVNEHYGEDHYHLYASYLNLSDLKKAQQRYAEAEMYIDRAIFVVKKTYGRIHPWLAVCYQHKAELLAIQNKFVDARKAIEKGIEAVYPSEIRQKLEEVVYHETQSPITLHDLMVEKSAIFQSEYKLNPDNLYLLDSALDYYQYANSITDHLRRGFVAEGSKVFFQGEAMKLYDKAIHLCQILYEETENVKYLEKAFYYSEKNKATVLAESLLEADMKQLQGIPSELVEEEKALKKEITSLEKTLLEDPGNLAVSDQMFQLKWHYDSLAKVISDLYPQYYDLKYDLQVATIADVQNRLESGQAALSFFEGDSSWYIFCISRENFSLKSVSKENVPESALEKFRLAVSNNKVDFLEYAAINYQIYSNLIQPSLAETDGIDHLLFIPDGIFGYLPYEAFITEPLGENPPNYLLQDYNVSYASSLTLFTKDLIKAHQAEIPYIGFAPSYSNSLGNSEDLIAYRDVLTELSGTSTEVNFAAKLFGGKTYIGDDATEANFKHLNQSASIIHLAMHALVDDKDPIRSKLIFSKSETDSLEDGNLNAYEIYNLKLSANLAVLSACNTGYGKINKGEGVMSLSRAFLFAECPSVVMSLWRATDQPTAEIMGSFFQYLKDGESKDEALRQAKLDYLEEADPLKAHPANWATFVLLGDTKPIDFGYSNYMVWVLLGITISALLLLVYFKKRKPPVQTVNH